MMVLLSAVGIMVGIIGGIIYLVFRADRNDTYRIVMRENSKTFLVRYNPTIRKYYISIKYAGYETWVMGRLRFIKYYKDKNVATVEMERTKGNF